MINGAFEKYRFHVVVHLAAQAGVRSSLKLLRVVKDAGLIVRARELGEEILAADPDLVRHAGLRDAILRRVSDEDRAALAKN